MAELPLNRTTLDDGSVSATTLEPTVASGTVLDGTGAGSVRTAIDGAATSLDGGKATSQVSSRLPSVLEGRYEIVRPLASGGSEASLYLVKSRGASGQFVAKIYHKGILPDSEVLQRVAQVIPAHVIQLHEHGESDGVWYEILEYARHGSLREVIASRDLTEGYQERAFKELFEAIRDLHNGGVIHRDLKPENILVRKMRPFDLILTDFGISTIAESASNYTTASRTVRYAAPEAVSGVVGKEADYWALGMIIVELLTGKHPFEGLSDPVITRALATKPVNVSGVPGKWRALCLGLLTRDPSRRWGEQEVARWLAGDRTLVAPPEESTETGPTAVLRPYRFNKVDCWTPAELAAHLVTDWGAALKDLGRGYITSWFKEEVKDQDMIRWLDDMAEDRATLPDHKLLRFVYRLAPELPAVWKGYPVEIQDLLAVANSNDEKFVESFFRDIDDNKVLEFFAQLGRQDHARYCESMARLVEEYESAWDKAVACGAPKSRKPLLRTVYRWLVMACLDEELGDRLRESINQGLKGYADYCLWFRPFGTMQTATVSSLLVMNLLVPDAGRALEEARKTIKSRYEKLRASAAESLSAKEYLNSLHHLFKSSTAQDLDELDRKLAETRNWQVTDRLNKRLVECKGTVEYLIKWEENNFREAEQADAAISLYRELSDAAADTSCAREQLASLQHLSQNMKAGDPARLWSELTSVRTWTFFDQIQNRPVNIRGDVRTLLNWEKTNLAEARAARSDCLRDHELEQVSSGYLPSGQNTSEQPTAHHASEVSRTVTEVSLDTSLVSRKTSNDENISTECLRDLEFEQQGTSAASPDESSQESSTKIVKPTPAQPSSSRSTMWALFSVSILVLCGVLVFNPSVPKIMKSIIRGSQTEDSAIINESESNPQQATTPALKAKKGKSNRKEDSGTKSANAVAATKKNYKEPLINVAGEENPYQFAKDVDVKSSSDNELLTTSKEGNADAQYKLAEQKRLNAISEEQDAEALRWYRKAAEQGHRKAAYKLAQMTFSGRGTNPDFAEAFRWYKKAAKQGDPDAQYELGKMYQVGIGVPGGPNREEGFRWLRKASAQGNVEASKLMAILEQTPLLQIK